MSRVVIEGRALQDFIAEAESIKRLVNEAQGHAASNKRLLDEAQNRSHRLTEALRAFTN